MLEKILLKKYANRRLYDTVKSTYVTLGQLAEMIKAGNQVEVIDAKTKEDVTAFILTQIIMEKAKKKNVLLPVPLLHLIIQHGEDVLEEFFDKYFEQTLKNYLAYKSLVDEQFKRWLEIGTDFSDITQKTIADLSPFQTMLNPFREPSKSQEEKAVNDDRQASKKP